MDWIRFDLEHRPQDGEFVMVTAIMNNKKLLYKNAKWVTSRNAFYVTCGDFSLYMGDDKVTHWMRYPDPADS